MGQQRAAADFSQKKELHLARWIIPSAIGLLTFVSFLPALWNGFVDWDDFKVLVENPNYKGLSWANLHWMFSTFFYGHYHPLTWLSHAIDYSIWGTSPFGYHLTNLIVHSLNAVLFYLVALHLLGITSPDLKQSHETHLKVAAAGAALFFSVHPLRVESVAWATERRDVLSGFFFLLSILAYLRFASRCDAGESSVAWLLLSVLADLFSLLSKAMAVTLPVVFIVLDVYPLRRLGGSKGWFRKDARRVWLEKIPYLVATGLFIPLAMAASFGVEPAMSVGEYGILPRLANLSYGLAFYLRKTVIPTGLIPVCQWSVEDIYMSPWRFIGSAGLIAAIGVAIFLSRRRLPGALAAGVYYVAVVSPVLGFFRSGEKIVADRYSYLPCLGWAILVAGILLRFSLRMRNHGNRLVPRAVVGSSVVILTMLASLTYRQTLVWRDSFSLWEHTVAQDPGSAIAHNNLGVLNGKQGRMEEAFDHLNRAIEIVPGYTEAYLNRGFAYESMNRFEDARSQYAMAVQIDPGKASAHSDLARTYARLGRSDDALRHYEEALRIDPSSSKVHTNLGTLFVSLGKLDGAEKHFQAALRIDPNDVKAHINLGLLYLHGFKDKQGALSELRKALQIDPDGLRRSGIENLVLQLEQDPR